MSRLLQHPAATAAGPTSVKAAHPDTASARPAAGIAAPRRVPRVAVVAGLAGLVLLTVLVAASLGPVATSPGTVLLVLLEPARPAFDAIGLGLPVAEPVHASLVATIRLPRVLLAALTGAALACAGAVMQAVFRNPLAEPGITGVSSGAACAAVLLIVTGVAQATPWALPVGAFAGALAAVAVVQGVAGITRPGSAGTLLLVGIALNALLGAVIAAAIANAPDAEDVQRATFWLNGDLTAATWADVLLIVVPVLLGLAALLCLTRELNLMVLSEEAAAATGVNTTMVRHVGLGIAALITAACVSVTGVISFVGLVVPHLVRLVIGPDHRRLLPVSIAVGAVFLALADLGARLLFSPVVLQTGVVTAVIGAPVLLALVMRRSAAVPR
ncbi:FecCD family ABC transporter permease [Occultella aeris]|uniref:FecCD family ABC transporter permease n=1 Tax=Occultella aeris TaxID=2761496 RepID=UPI001E537D34|nr:iron ABC transporter permease [Occultella aeris]